MLISEEEEEFERVAASFCQTLPNKNVVRIERIQNRVLWKKYVDKSRQMYQFGNGILNELLLFHGSRSHNPEEIYKGDASFDMRFSNEGMWGKGNYFAVNASYSDLFAFKVFTAAMPFKKMLAAWVLTGNSYQSPPHNFQYPPFLGDTSEDGVKRKYDSVNGTTGGSKVYITYDNSLAYPAYLITYN